MRRALDLRRSTPKGVMVLGMHRSGTSAATRLVNLLGPATCDVNDMVRGPWNPLGHWESRSLMHLNDRILAEMGRSWWHPPPDADEYGPVAAGIVTSTAEARNEFRRVHRSVPWVWKDPRTCVLLPFWRAALGPRVAAVIVFRNPMEVALSLESRHSLPSSFGVALWERYNRLLLAHAEGMPTLVTTYDDIVGDPSRWVADVRAFLVGLGMRVRGAPDAESLAQVVDPELRHSTQDLSELAGNDGARAVYGALQAAAGPSASFASPVLPAEHPGVSEELDQWGPTDVPPWRPPPWQPRPATDPDGRL
jgi:hypothetical protein